MSIQGYVVKTAVGRRALQTLIDEAVAKGLKPLFVTEGETGFTVIFG